ncbi:MAG: nitroreductase [Bacteroidales bacterium]|nr:nitroreductase [Bacteroidales bacterium]
MNTDFIDIIKTRRSCRRYKPDQIDDRALQAVLEAGTYAPTSKGQQSPFIVAVQDPALLKRLARMNADVMGTDTNPYYDAPTYIFVFAPADGRNPVQDGSCVMQNLMLAAHALGLATCWINREREMFATDEGQALMRQWGLPDGLMGIAAVAIGYADGAPDAPKPRKDGYYRIIR